MPFEDSDIDQGEINYSQSVRDVWTKINPSYNFYIKAYEDVIDDTTVPEALLPNLYVFASEFDNRFEDPLLGSTSLGSRFKQFIDLVDDNSVAHIDNMFTDIKENGRKVGEKDNGQYFEEWARVLENNGSQLFSRLENSFTNLVIPMENLNLLSEHIGDERLFPMHIKLDFVTDIETRFADELHDANLFLPLIDQVMGAPTEVEALWSFRWWNEVVTEMCEYVNDYSTTHTWDIGQWLWQTPRYTSMLMTLPGATPGSGVFGNMASNINSSARHLTILGRYVEELEKMANPANVLYVLLMMLRFQTALTNIAKPSRDGGKFRSFKEILQGKEAYSETLLYRIEKLDASNDQTIQSIWLPNSSQVDALSYIDTQVKYNKKYRYKIWSYQIVIGNKYEYKVAGIGHGSTSGADGSTVTYNGQQERLGGFLARLCVFNEPSIRLIEVPYYDTKIDYPDGIAVMDNPPVRPDINIIPYQNTGDKLLLWLNGNVGDYWEEPISILPEDDFTEMLQYHGRDTNNDSDPDELHFKSDDHVTQFDIFKLSHRPRKYEEFLEGTHRRIDTAQGSTSADFIDDIKPNTKYYYTFRALDNHNHVSNPSPVYECELVKDNENIYSLIRIIDMDVDLGRQTTKAGRKFLQIKPAFSQALLNESELATDAKKLVNNNGEWLVANQENVEVPVTLGSAEKSIWGNSSPGRKFKIRLTSKKSSKKFDINVKFKVNKERME